MTAICPSGGTSSGKAGFPEFVALSNQAIGAMLSQLPLQYAVPFAGLLGLITFELNTFCTIDPPTLPTLVLSDFTDLLTLIDPIAHGVAQRHWQDFISYYAWFQFCKCDTDPTPNPTTPQAAPSGLPGINPPGAGGGTPPSTTPCQSYALSGTGYNSTTSFGPFPIGAATAASITFNTNIQTTASGVHYIAEMRFTNASHAFISSIGSGITHTGITQSGVVCVPSGTAFYDFDISSGGGSPPTPTWNVEWDLFCGGGCGGGPVLLPSPCVADATTTLTLQQILEIVTLIQRQHVPFATVHGTAHTGLSGNGQFSVQGLLGIAVDLTTTPSRLGRVSGDPDTIYDAGWVNVGTADGWGLRHFISSDPFIVSPVGGDVTLVGYSIPDDVVVTITELVREP